MRDKTAGDEKRITIKFPKDISEELDEYAEKMSITINKFIRLAVREKLDREKDPLAKCGDREELEKMMMEIVQREMRKDRL